MTDSVVTEVVICSVCGVVPPGRSGKRPVCHRCQAGRLIDRALDSGNGATSPALLPLAEMLRAARPETVLRWLSRPQPRALLAELAAGRMPLTHEALHECPHRNAAEHLRHQLVACGLLPAVDAQLVAFEGWIHRRLGQCADHPHQRLLRQFGLWHQLSRLRADAATRPLRPTAKAYAAGQFTAAQTFLTWAHAHNIEPRRLRQRDLDTWAISHTARERYGAQGFLIWAVESGHLSRRLDIPREKFNIGPAITQQRRLTLLRKYLTDDEPPVAARVAACLLLLYALPVSRILSLTRHDLLDEHGELFLRLGDPPTPIPEPLASLLREIADASPSQHGWLFPGRNSGQPMTYRTLFFRLRGLGLAVREARISALRQLVLQAPAPVIAAALGIHHTTTTRQAVNAGTTWSRYASRNHDPSP
ncbi:hypothetical protein ACQPZJ_44370 [Actinoplanes sp. CA-054009]